jgi:hypothetical protein
VVDCKSIFLECVIWSQRLLKEKVEGKGKTSKNQMIRRKNSRQNKCLPDILM